MLWILKVFPFLERPFRQVHMKVHAEPNALASKLHPELVREYGDVRHESFGPQLFSSFSNGEDIFLGEVRALVCPSLWMPILR